MVVCEKKQPVGTFPRPNDLFRDSPQVSIPTELSRKDNDPEQDNSITIIKNAPLPLATTGLGAKSKLLSKIDESNKARKESERKEGSSSSSLSPSSLWAAKLFAQVQRAKRNIQLVSGRGQSSPTCYIASACSDFELLEKREVAVWWWRAIGR
jgi:hypothetical protein